MIDSFILRKLEAKYGSAIRYSKDCEALAVSINKTCNQQVSVTTLKRLLGFAKSIENPRLYTLDAIAIYLGYTNWNTLQKDIETETVLSNSNEFKDHYNSLNYDAKNIETFLLKHYVQHSLSTEVLDTEYIRNVCLKYGKQNDIFIFITENIKHAFLNRDTNFLKILFSLPNIFDENIHSWEQIYYIGQTFGQLCRKHEDIIIEIADTIASIANAQKYFIEWFVDENYLNGFYGIMLDYYHKYKNTNTCDLIFYYALKYRQAVQNKTLEEQTKWYNKLIAITPPENLHEIPAGRFTGICLYDNKINSLYNNADIYKLIEKYIHQPVFERAVGFTLYAAKELYNTTNKQLLIELIIEFDLHHTSSSINTHWGIKNLNELLIYKTYVYILNNQIDQAKRLFTYIDKNLFDCFISKQINQHYLQVKEML